MLIWQRDMPHHAASSQWPDYFQPRLTLGDLILSFTRRIVPAVASFYLYLDLCGVQMLQYSFMCVLRLPVCRFFISIFPKGKPVESLSWLRLTSSHFLCLLLSLFSPIKQSKFFHHGGHDQETRRCAGLSIAGHRNRAFRCFWRYTLRVCSRMAVGLLSFR